MFLRGTERLCHFGRNTCTKAMLRDEIAHVQGMPMHMGSGNGAFGAVPMQGVPVHSGGGIEGLGGSGMFSGLEGGGGSNVDLQQAASMLNGVRDRL